jgi:hypothetical protein
MAESFRQTLPPHKAQEQIELLELLTIRPVRAAATVPDDAGVADEFASLWPPTTKVEAARREQQHRSRVAASRPEDDDDLYLAIFGEPPR